MRKDFGAKAWIYPMPVLILAAYNEDGAPMAMNGIGSNQTVVLGLGRHHKTTDYLLKTGAFTLSPATEGTLIPCDYVGIDSGKDVPDKMERSGFHCHRAAAVNAPVIEELPMTMECELIRYDEEAELLIGRILNVSAEESILDEKGRIEADKARFLTLDPANLRYRTLGPMVGRAFHDGLPLSSRHTVKPFEDQPGTL